MLIYIHLFIIEFIIFSLFFTYFNLKISDKYILKYHKLILWLVIILQIISCLLNQKEVMDVMLFSGAGHYLRQKIDFYFIDSDHLQYPFFPFLIFPYAILNWLSEAIPMFTFSFYLKILILLPSFYLISRVVYWQNYKIDKLTALKSQLQFLTNPIAVGVIYLHGQIDIILLLFLIYAWIFLFDKSQFKKKFYLKFLSREQSNVFIGSVLFGLSILSKTWSIIFIPQILKLQQNLKNSFLTIVIVILGIMADVFIYTRYVFGSGFRVVMPAVLMTSRPANIWGIPYFFNQLFPKIGSEKLFFLIFILLMVLLQLYIFFKKEKGDVWRLTLLNLLGTLLILPGFGIQYLIWIIPFIYLTKHSRRYGLIYIVLASLLILIQYINIIVWSTLIPLFIVSALYTIVWSYCLFWFYKIIFYENK